jgi:hypothetical protein
MDIDFQRVCDVLAGKTGGRRAGHSFSLAVRIVFKSIEPGKDIVIPCPNEHCRYDIMCMIHEIALEIGIPVERRKKNSAKIGNRNIETTTYNRYDQPEFKPARELEVIFD